MTEILINNTLTNILNDFFYYNDDYEDEERENIKYCLSKVVKDNLNDFSKKYFNNLKENNLIYCSSNWNNVEEILNLREELKNTKLELKNIKEKLRDTEEDLNNSMKQIDNLNEEISNKNQKLKDVTKWKIKYKNNSNNYLLENEILFEENEYLKEEIKNNYVSKDELEKFKHNLTNFFDDLDNHMKEIKKYLNYRSLFNFEYEKTLDIINNFKKFSDNFFENNLNNTDESNEELEEEIEEEDSD